MCSVVGYIGKNYSRAYVMEGLSRLEYRGYDSAGFACLNAEDHHILYAKSSGNLSNLVKKFETLPIDGFSGIGHTRWSTHGVSSERNAHPHFDCSKKISLVHNGIIENHHALKNELNDSHSFHSETDTEVIAHVLEDALAELGSPQPAFVKLMSRLDGAYACIVLLKDYPDYMIVMRKRLPLCIGMGDGEMFIASDVVAFAGKTNKVVFLPDESFAFVHKDLIAVYDHTGNALPLAVQTVDVDWKQYEKTGYDHYMLKEIDEQRKTLQETVSFFKSLKLHVWDNLGITCDVVQKLSAIHLIACGTSWHAGFMAQYFFEQIALIPAQVHLASEFRYRSFFADPHALYIFVSQSGETADTLEALRMVNGMQLPTVVITNIASSTMVREAQGFLLTQAGREIAVASTKAFTNQVAALYWLAHRFALEKRTITTDSMEQAEDDLCIAAELLENAIEHYRFEIMHTIAKQYAHYNKAIFLGRHITYPLALEAALKLKEIAYVFTQGYPAGELKHGPLALIDEQTPVIIFSHQDPLIYQKLLANAHEVKARGGHLIAFIVQGQEELYKLAHTAFIFPPIKPLLSPLVMTGLMQYFIYMIAKERGCAIDKPRNLAKSVTVE